MTRLDHNVKGANQNAVRVLVENVSVIVPACNIDLDQPGQWAAYFEFGLTEQCTVHGAGNVRHIAFQAAFNRYTKHWEVEERRPGWDSGRCHKQWFKLPPTFEDTADDFAEAIWRWSEAPLTWFTPRFGQRYEDLVNESCERCFI